MSFGKIVRKIVKKWLKKDGGAGVLEPSDYDLYADDGTLRLSCEPCMFCAERDGACSGGDLNRNTHISDEMGFATGDGGGVLDSSGPFHGAAPFADDTAGFPFDSAACQSSRSPVPVCVCEACYIFVSSNLPSAMSPSSSSSSSRTAAAAAAAAGRSFAGDGDCDCDSECCPCRGRVDAADSKRAFGDFARPGVVSNEVDDVVGCNKHCSISQTSNTRRIHSASSSKRRLGGHATEQLETICPNPDDLPVSVAVSLDGEEGFARGQRHLHGRNRWYNSAAAATQTRFRPPPNKTICHVVANKRTDNVVS